MNERMKHPQNHMKHEHQEFLRGKPKMEKTTVKVSSQYIIFGYSIF